MICYVIKDDFVILHVIKSNENSVIACNEMYSILDQESIDALIEAELPVIFPSEEIDGKRN